MDDTPFTERAGWLNGNSESDKEIGFVCGAENEHFVANKPPLVNLKQYCELRGRSAETSVYISENLLLFEPQVVFIANARGPRIELALVQAGEMGIQCHW
jgi:hypothetical protein